MLKQYLNASISGINTYACSSHGWEVIQDYIHHLLSGLDPEYYALAKGSASSEWLEVIGRSSERRLSMIIGSDEPEGYDLYSVLVTIQ